MRAILAVFAFVMSWLQCTAADLGQARLVACLATGFLLHLNSAARVRDGELAEELSVDLFAESATKEFQLGPESATKEFQFGPEAKMLDVHWTLTERTPESPGSSAYLTKDVHYSGVFVLGRGRIKVDSIEDNSCLSRCKITESKEWCNGAGSSFSGNKARRPVAEYPFLQDRSSRAIPVERKSRIGLKLCCEIDTCDGAPEDLNYVNLDPNVTYYRTPQQCLCCDQEIKCSDDNVELCVDEFNLERPKELDAHCSAHFSAKPVAVRISTNFLEDHVPAIPHPKSWFSRCRDVCTQVGKIPKRMQED